MASKVCSVTQLFDELSWTWPVRLEMFVGLCLWSYDCSTPRRRNMQETVLSFLLFFIQYNKKIGKISQLVSHSFCLLYPSYNSLFTFI